MVELEVLSSKLDHNLRSEIITFVKFYAKIASDTKWKNTFISVVLHAIHICDERSLREFKLCTHFLYMSIAYTDQFTHNSII